jgi:hypothetical protein
LQVLGGQLCDGRRRSIDKHLRVAPVHNESASSRSPQHQLSGSRFVLSLFPSPFPSPSARGASYPYPALRTLFFLRSNRSRCLTFEAERLLYHNSRLQVQTGRREIVVGLECRPAPVILKNARFTAGRSVQILAGTTHALAYPLLCVFSEKSDLGRLCFPSRLGKNTRFLIHLDDSSAPSSTTILLSMLSSQP